MHQYSGYQYLVIPVIYYAPHPHSPRIVAFLLCVAVILVPVAAGVADMGPQTDQAVADAGAPGTGSIMVLSYPAGATVWVDGIDLGKTPFSRSGFTIGLHTLSVRKEGYIPYERNARVSSFTPAIFRAFLTPESGPLAVNSHPAGATVYVNGSYFGTTPTGPHVIPSGSHLLEVKKEGYEPFSRVISIGPRNIRYVTCTLRRSSGPEEITAPAIIRRSGHYILQNDLSGSDADAAIRIMASNVILDGNGHTLGGVGNRSSSGVLVESAAGGPLRNVSISRLTLTSWGTGVSLKDLSYGKLDSCTASGNTVGVRVDGGGRNDLLSCSATGNHDAGGEDGNGIELLDTTGTRLRVCTISGNTGGDILAGGHGLHAVSSPGTLVESSHIEGNSGAGITVFSSDGFSVRACVMNRNGGAGILLQGPSTTGGQIRDNIILGSDTGIDTGIGLTDADMQEIVGNSVTGCDRGIQLSRSGGCMVQGNTLSGSTSNFGIEGVDDWSFDHVIDLSNTVDGRPIVYSKGSTGETIDASSNAGTVVATGCRNLTVTGLSLSGNAAGVTLWNCESPVIDSVEARNNYIGIALFRSPFAHVLDCTASENCYTGIVTSESPGTTISGGTVEANAFSGTDIFYSPVSRVEGLAALSSPGDGSEGSGDGINIYESPLSVVSGCDASANERLGIGVLDSPATEVSGNSVDDNCWVGIGLIGDGVIIRGNWITGNAVTGLGIREGSGNLIVDNYFSNDLNAALYGEAEGNIWNLTKQDGPNIVEGLFLGGNFWGAPDGTGFSETHADRGDGFCDESFSIGTNNTDFLPLHLPFTDMSPVNTAGRPNKTNVSEVKKR